MAKSNSFNKREIEKSKQQKRKEKQQRKEERKNNPTSSFEDMIAYVDENGVIVDTPPEVVNTPVELEDIEISVPKKEEADEEDFTTGKVEFFDETKGFGFIKDKSGANKYFFHRSNAPEGIKDNDNVTFDLERGPRGMNAVNVQIIK